MLTQRIPNVLLGLIALCIIATIGCESSTRVATFSDETAIHEAGGMGSTGHLCPE